MWNFFHTFKHYFGVSAFTVEELHQSLLASDADHGFLFAFLIHCLLQGYIKDIREFNEKEMYATPAILVLELAEELPHFPLEAISLIFRIKRYKKCVALGTQELLIKLLAEKSGSPAGVLHSIDYRAKKEILLSLTRGICVCPKLRDTVNKTVQDQKDIKYLEKRRAVLQKEVDLFTSIDKSSKPGEIVLTAEKRKEINGKQREIGKLSAELKKLKVHQTQMLGTDADEREYWVFGADKDRLYVRAFEEGRERWGTYSAKTQTDALMNTLLEKGMMEKKLKGKLQAVLPGIHIADPAADSNKDE